MNTHSTSGPSLRFDLIFDKLFLEASYTYSRVNDKIQDRDRDRNLVWLQLGLEWPILK